MRRLLTTLTVGAALVTTARAQAPAGGAPAGDGDGPVHVLHVQGHVYLLVGPEVNSTVQVGEDGVLVVDSQPAAMAPAVIAAIRTLSPEPIRVIVNTNLHPAHVGGNDALSTLGAVGPPQAVRIMAHENALRRLMTTGANATALVPEPGLPMSSYYTPTRDFHFNGEAIILHHVPAAHTDGDTLVQFRSSDVISVGDLFTPDHYPVIDLDNGGSAQGLIDGLNDLLALTVPARYQEGGTYVIPGHGRVCDEAEVVEYRDMVTIIRDRVQDLIGKGLTLEQIQADRPSRDYDTEYGPDGAEALVEAIYRGLAS